MDKSTFSILFIMQKGKPNAEGNAPIFARITINHQMTHLATRYYLPPERWLPKEGRTVGRTKEEKEVNAYLDTPLLLPPLQARNGGDTYGVQKKGVIANREIAHYSTIAWRMPSTS